MVVVRVRQRWMSWPWGIFGLVFAVIFGCVGLYSLKVYPHERPSAWLAAPMYWLAVYWVIALLFNRRTAVAGPDGVRVLVWPFFVRLPQRAGREQIRSCFVCRVGIADDETLLETYYTAGVETRGGKDIEMGVFATVAEAERMAGEMAAALNRASGRAPVGVVFLEEMRGQVAGKVMMVLFWLALFIGAIIAGAVWEERLAAGLRAGSGTSAERDLHRKTELGPARETAFERADGLDAPAVQAHGRGGGAGDFVGAGTVED